MSRSRHTSGICSSWLCWPWLLQAKSRWCPLSPSAPPPSPAPAQPSELSLHPRVRPSPGNPLLVLGGCRAVRVSWVTEALGSGGNAGLRGAGLGYVLSAEREKEKQGSSDGWAGRACATSSWKQGNSKSVDRGVRNACCKHTPLMMRKMSLRGLASVLGDSRARRRVCLVLQICWTLPILRVSVGQIYEPGPLPTAPFCLPLGLQDLPSFPGTAC